MGVCVRECLCWLEVGVGGGSVGKEGVDEAVTNIFFVCICLCVCVF